MARILMKTAIPPEPVEPEGGGMASDPPAVRIVRLYVRTIAARLVDG